MDRSRAIPLSRNCSRFWPRPTTGWGNETKRWRLAGPGGHDIRKTRSCCTWKGFSIGKGENGTRRLGACKSWWQEKKKITAENAQGAAKTHRRLAARAAARKLLL